MSMRGLLVVASCVAWISVHASIDETFDSHENIRLQSIGQGITLLKQTFLAPLDAAFDPHVNLETIESSNEKLGIYYDDVPLKPHYFKQAIVDHFQKKSEYWTQRYYLNKEHWGGPGYPVFLMIGGEAPIQPTDVSQEMFLMNTLGIEHKALLVSLEHRYYGVSIPTPDMSVENLQYLTIDQALNDIVVFQEHLKTKYAMDTSKWIAFGGSYPGNLAVWLKQEFPTLFVGSVASSAPVLLVPNYKEYMQVVSDGFISIGGAKCGKAIQRAMQALDDAIVEALRHNKKKKSTKSLALYQVLRICDPLTNEMDAMVLESIIKNEFQGIAQYNDFNPVTIQSTCEYFETVTSEKPLAQLAGFLAMTSPGRCYMSTFDGTENSTIHYQSADLIHCLIGLLQQTVYTKTNFDGVSIERQWTYHRCTELGYTQSAADAKSIFQPLQFTSFELAGTQFCQALFGDAFNFPNVRAVNKRLGGNRPKTSNVTFTNGDIDPWYPLGVIEKKQLHDESNSLLFLHGTSHCRDMYAPQVNDSKEIQTAHKKIAANVANYLT